MILGCVNHAGQRNMPFRQEGNTIGMDQQGNGELSFELI